MLFFFFHHLVILITHSQYEGDASQKGSTWQRMEEKCSTGEIAHHNRYHSDRSQQQRGLVRNALESDLKIQHWPEAANTMARHQIGMTQAAKRFCLPYWNNCMRSTALRCETTLNLADKWQGHGHFTEKIALRVNHQIIKEVFWPFVVLVHSHMRHNILMDGPDKWDMWCQLLSNNSSATQLASLDHTDWYHLTYLHHR